MEKSNEAFNIVSIHGVRLDRVDLSGAALHIAGLLRQNGTPRTPYTVFTPNAEIIYRCSKDIRLCSLINSGSLNVPDGIGAFWASKKLGSPLPCRVPGIELAETVFEMCRPDGIRVFLLGGKPGVAEKASSRLASRFPGLVICGARHGYFSLTGEENASILNDINTASPDLLIVCLGFPRQEEWTAASRSSLAGVKVIMALGGSIDVWSGNVRRAPSLLRAAGLEWFWRIARNPSRLKRSAALPAFVLLTLREKRRLKRSPRVSPSDFPPSDV